MDKVFKIKLSSNQNEMSIQVFQARKFGMDRKTIFTITLSGEGEIKSHTSHLSGDIKRALMLVDDKSTVAELSKRAAPSLRSSLDEMLQELLDGGFIQDKSRKDNAPRIVTPRIVTPVTKGKEEGEDLDFTIVMRPPTAEFLAAETARVKAQAEAQAQAERVRVTAEIAEMKARAAAQAKQDAQIRQEAKARQDAEVERIRKEQEEAIARVRAEVETRAKQEAEAARIKAEQATAKANADAEAARAEMEQVRAKLAEAKAAEEVKARADALAQQAAKQEAEAARIRAEQETAKANADAEAARAEMEQVRAKLAEAKAAEEAKARADALAQQAAKQEAEAARIKAEQEADVARTAAEAIRIKAEQATARANADAEAARAEMELVRAKMAEAKAAEEAKARADALAQQEAKREAEAVRIRAEQAAETARAEAEAARIKAEQDMAQAKAEVGEARMEAKHARTELAQNMARAQAEEKSRAAVIDQAGAQPTPYDFQLDSLFLTGFESPPLVVAPTAVPSMDAMHAGEGVSEPKVQQKQVEIEAVERAVELKSRHEADVAQAKAVQDAAQLHADTRQMADEQARVWAEAKQRAQALAAAQALVDAKAKAELAAQQASRQAQEKKASARRGPVPWGKMAAGLLVVLLVLAAILPYVLPMQDYVVQMEQKLSAQLQQPVHILKMKAVLLPLPRLELQQVEVGGSQEFKATSVVLNFNLSALFAETRAINSVEINDLVLNAESFAQTLALLRAAGGDVHYPVARMALHRARVEGAGLPTMNGHADWNDQQRLDKLALTSEDGKLDVKLQSQNARWQIALNIKEGSLPILPALMLHELSAQGEVSESAANFNEISGGLYGGMLSGNAQLNWQHGWQMQGRVTVKMLELHDLFPQFGIAGEMAGDSAFLLRGATLAQLANTTHLDGSVVLKKGVISKIDIVRTASDASRLGAAGGRTNFDELSAMLQLENNKLSLSQIRLSAGVMSATGAAEVSSGNTLSGRLNVDLKMRAGQSSIPLVLSGTPKEPVLRVAR